MPVFMDSPAEQLPTPGFLVDGWVASQSTNARIVVRVDGRVMLHTLYDRPDVRRALPLFATITGVRSAVDVTEHAANRPIVVELECDGELVSRSCRLGSAPPAPTRAETDLRKRAREWCIDRLSCPNCRAGREQLSFETGRIVCGSCAMAFLQNSDALNLISEQAGISAGVVATTNVSSNPYTPDALDLIRTVTGANGWVLDCGAGSRPERLPNVINVEIADYASSDVLAVGEALPFADNSFDAILSLAVLEHVRDPFTCARELVRVLRPGGQLLADVPFLQPVHGYPDHYYNMTPAGLRNLFAGMGDVLECRVPLHGHPIFAVQWLLGAYLGGLPGPSRARFAAMTIGEAACLSPHAFLADASCMELSLEAQQVVGCLNSLRFRKAD